MTIWNPSEETLPFWVSHKFFAMMERIRHKTENEDTMFIGIIGGAVGSGKSVIVQKGVYIISGDKINLDKIAFDKEQFIKAVLMSRNEAIIADEGVSIFFSRGAMTKEGRLMAELMAQIRQKNLAVFICIPDILTCDSMVLSAASLVGHVWESRKMVGGRMVTIKGNIRLYPTFRGNDYKERYIHYLRQKRGNPFIKVTRPQAWLTQPGEPYGASFKPAFYCVPEDQYREKKEAILNKYRKSLERKKPNLKIDYSTMDKMLKAGVVQKDIAAFLNVVPKVIQNYKKGIYSKRIIKKARRA